MDYRIFDVRTDVNACSCTLGWTNTVRESALKVHPGRKISCSTGELNLRRRCAGPMLDQLSYILKPKLKDKGWDQHLVRRVILFFTIKLVKLTREGISISWFIGKRNANRCDHLQEKYQPGG